MDIQRTSKRDLAKQRFLAWARENNVSAGDKVMSQNELAQATGVSSLTAFKALAELERAKVIHRIQGKGTFWGPRKTEKRPKSACLVLPGVGADSSTHNPDYCQAVQNLVMNFFQATGDRWEGSIKTVPLTDKAPEDIAAYEAYNGIFFHHTQEPRALLDALIQRKRVPVAIVGIPRKPMDCLAVGHDREAAVTIAVQYLFERGHRNIAYVGSDEPWGEISLAGYRRALEEQGVSFAPESVLRVPSSPSCAAVATRDIAQRGLPCDAIFVDSDLRAVWVLDELRRQGVRVPEDVGIMGYEGISSLVDHAPRLTSLRVPYAQMFQAALSIFERLTDLASLIRSMTFVGSVHEGRTTW